MVTLLKSDLLEFPNLTKANSDSSPGPSSASKTQRLLRERWSSTSTAPHTQGGACFTLMYSALNKEADRGASVSLLLIGSAGTS